MRTVLSGMVTPLFDHSNQLAVIALTQLLVELRYQKPPSYPVILPNSPGPNPLMLDIAYVKDKDALGPLHIRVGGQTAHFFVLV